jgi:hypothetical protein
MDRMGHSSTRAALVYLHATSQRQRTIADAVGTMTRAALREIDEHSSNPASGTDLARSHESSPWLPGTSAKGQPSDLGFCCGAGGV